MKTFPLFIALVVVAIASTRAAAREQAGHPQDALAGRWTNTDKKGGTTKLSITHENDVWSIQGWGACQPTDCDWGKTPLHLVGDSVSAADLPYGFAIWDAGFKDTYIILHIKGDKLEAESFSIYKDNSGRSNYRSVEHFKRADSDGK